MLDRYDGTSSLRVPIEQDRPDNRGNDVKVDSRGRAWVGTMAFDKRPRHAALYCVDGDVFHLDPATVSSPDVGSSA